jgi:23S rRNA pseudouridine2605 synthase
LRDLDELSVQLELAQESMDARAPLPAAAIGASEAAPGDASDDEGAVDDEEAEPRVGREHADDGCGRRVIDRPLKFLEERLHKVLAQHGMGSRRQVEEWIRAGRILVNGRPATIGQRIRTSDRIVLDGRDVTQRVGAAQRLRIVVYHKPGGELQRGRAGDDRSTVDARLPSLHSGRWLPINTLGFAEDGLLLAHERRCACSCGRPARRDLPVEYRVRVLRPRDGADWPSIPRAIDADGQRVEFAAVDRIDSPGSNVWFRLECARAVPRGRRARAVRCRGDSR